MVLTKQQGATMKIKFNKITMKNEVINIEEDKNLSKMLTASNGEQCRVYTKIEKEETTQLKGEQND